MDFGRSVEEEPPGALMPPATAATHATNHPPTTPRDAKDQTHDPLGGRGSTGGVFMLRDSHLHLKPIGLRIGEALDRHYLPGTMKSLAECVRDFDSFLFVNYQPERTEVEDFLSGQPGWRSTKLGPHTKLWERRAERAAE